MSNTKKLSDQQFKFLQAQSWLETLGFWFARIGKNLYMQRFSSFFAISDRPFEHSLEVTCFLNMIGTDEP